MSMPKIEIDPINRETAINNIIASIALEEAALSHILNAEGEKLQYVLANIPNVTLTQILEVNDSVSTLVNSAGSVEEILKEKLNTIVGTL